MTLDEYQKIVALSLRAIQAGERPAPALFDGPLEPLSDGPLDPAIRFALWIREGKWELRGSELWALWEQRRGFLAEPKRAERETANGYWTVRATEPASKKVVSTMSHRVVWTYFFGVIPPGMEVNHKNGFKDDNRITNLELVLPRTNKLHAAALGLSGAPKALDDIHGVLSDQDVADIHLLSKVDGKTQTEISERYGVSRTQISRVLSGSRRPMTFGVYQKIAARTSDPDKNKALRLAIAGLGVAGESGEVADIIKKHLGHGHDLDEDKLLLEISDVLWYLAELASILEIDLDEVAWRNSCKLRRRYPDGFSSEASINRTA